MPLFCPVCNTFYEKEDVQEVIEYQYINVGFKRYSVKYLCRICGSELVEEQNVQNKKSDELKMLKFKVEEMFQRVFNQIYAKMKDKKKDVPPSKLEEIAKRSAKKKVEKWLKENYGCCLADLGLTFKSDQ